MKQSKNEINLGEGSVGRLLLTLAVPSVIAQLVNLLYNLVDRIYIGHIPENGGVALTGLGLCFPILMIVTAFSGLIGYGGAPRVAIFMGKGKNDEAEEILGNCTMALIVIALILVVVLQFAAEPLLMLFGASDNTLPYALSYLNIYGKGTLFVMLTMGLNSFINTQGFSKVGMKTVLIGAVCNIILDPVFIFVFGMGVQGAALATVISQAISAVWVILFLTGKQTKLKIKTKYFKPKASVLLPVCALGVSPFIMNATESAINIAFNASLSRYGGDVAVGAMTILSSIMQLQFMPVQGIAQGAQPITSYNYGANNTERVKKTFRVLLTVSLIYSVTLWLAVMLMPQFFVSIFTPETAMIEFASKALRIYMAVMFLFGIQIACQMTFTALGNATSSIIVAVTRKFILLLPLIYIMPHMVSDKTMGVYLAEPVADFIAVTFTAILFYFQFRKAMNKIES